MDIVHSTPAEQARVWAAGTEEWGRPIGVEAYVNREAFLRTVPTATGRGMSYWVLTDKNPTTNPRPLYSTLETLHRRIWVARPNKLVFEAACHGIASVLTFPEMRAKGHATKLLTGVGERLRTHEGVDIRSFDPDSCITAHPGELPVACSMLFSDVGKVFYAQKGWLPFASKHALISLQQPPPSTDIPQAKPLKLDDIDALCKRDQELVRARLDEPSNSGKTRIAVIPDADIIRWHFSQEGGATSQIPIFGIVPTVRGAIWTSNPGGTGARIWIIFIRSYYDDPQDPLTPIGTNKLSILRLVIDEAETKMTHDELAAGLEAVLRCAIEEARIWRTPYLQLWNPSQRVMELLGRSNLDIQVIDREEDEILSLMWYGDEGASNVDWLETDRYCWC